MLDPLKSRWTFPLNSLITPRQMCHQSSINTIQFETTADTLLLSLCSIFWMQNKLGVLVSLVLVSDP